MSVQDNVPGDFVRREQEAATNESVRALFGGDPRDDPSGLLLSAPAPPAGEPDEDGLFAAHMRRFFPGSVE